MRLPSSLVLTSVLMPARPPAPMVVEIDLMDLPLRSGFEAFFVRDIWLRQDTGIVTRDTKLSLVMERHQAFLWLLKPVP